MDITKIVRKTCSTYNTENPFELAEAMDIHISYHDLGSVRGYYLKERRIMQIVLNYSLPWHLKRFVLAHELGHAVMHPDSRACFLQGALFSVDKIETQANTFAIELIMTDQDIMEHWDYSTDQWAMYYGLPVEIIQLRSRVQELAD